GFPYICFLTIIRFFQGNSGSNILFDSLQISAFFLLCSDCSICPMPLGGYLHGLLRNACRFCRPVSSHLEYRSYWLSPAFRTQMLPGQSSAYLQNKSKEH